MANKKTKKRPGSLARLLGLLYACNDAVEWVGAKTLTQAWRTCENPAWLFWLLQRSTGWRRQALKECLIEIMAAALESARAVAGKEAYWAKVESAHQLVTGALRGIGDMAAAGAAVADKRLCNIIRKHFPKAPTIRVAP